MHMIEHLLDDDLLILALLLELLMLVLLLGLLMLVILLELLMLVFLLGLCVVNVGSDALKSKP